MFLEPVGSMLHRRIDNVIFSGSIYSWLRKYTYFLSHMWTRVSRDRKLRLPYFLFLLRKGPENLAISSLSHKCGLWQVSTFYIKRNKKCGGFNFWSRDFRVHILSEPTIKIINCSSLIYNGLRGKLNIVITWFMKNYFLSESGI